MNLKGCFSHAHDNWATPQDFYNKLNEEFDFDDDPCPLDPNGTGAFFRPGGKRVFVNPPYSNIKGFLEKAILEMKEKHSEIIVFLVPARTDTRWFHDLVLPHNPEIRFIKGRLHFNNSGPAPFPSILIIFRGV